MKKILQLLLLFILLFILSAAVRSYVESTSFYQKALLVENNDGYAAAISYYKEALRWRNPFTSADSKAKKRLYECTFSNECQDKVESLRGLRTGIMASRSWITYFRDKELLERIEIRENELLGEKVVNFAKTPQWNVWFQIFSQCAFLLWFSSVLYGIWYGFSPSGEMYSKVLFPCLGIWLVGFSLWLYLLRLA